MDLVEIPGGRDKFTVILSSNVAVFKIAFCDVFFSNLYQL
jgi:hypothetical protein